MKRRVPASMMTVVLAVLVSAAPSAAGAVQAAHHRPAQHQSAGTATPIKHFLFLMQGGRTFDNYFGTYPGATGTPAGTCQLRVKSRPRAGCVRPFLLTGSQQPPLGASRTTITGQYDHGKMDGFVSSYQQQARNGTRVMGYYNRSELPFYWTAATRYVLFDHFFSSVSYGIRANRSFWVSAAAAPGGLNGAIPVGGYGQQRTIFDRLQAADISWKFYVQDYNPRDTYRNAGPDSLETQTSRVPLVDYRRFTHDPALAQHIVGLDQYYRDLADGTLPAVAYIASAAGDNERSSRTIGAGQSLVSNLVTQLMQSHYWGSSALMWSYDGSGGWFDHVRPPRAGGARLGFRVPALLVSAYARKGQIDHTVLDYTSALKFIEQNWRLAPLTARDASANSVAGAFDFAAGPRPPALIPSRPAVPAAQSSAHLSPTPVAAIYLLYGGAALAGMLFLLCAAWWPGLSVRRQALAASRAAKTDGAG